MSWADEAIPAVRVMLDDTVATFRYTDDQILNAWIWAAKQVIIDATGIGFINHYTISVSDQEISPDPTDTATLDNAFFTMVTLKAACVISYGAAIKTSGQAIRIVDAKSEIDLRNSFGARLQAAKDGWCKEYKTALLQYILDARSGGGPNPNGGNGRLVTTPIRLF